MFPAPGATRLHGTAQKTGTKKSGSPESHPPGDLVEVVLDGLGKSVMVRFTEDTVPVVNIEEGLMVINRSEIGEDL